MGINALCLIGEGAVLTGALWAGPTVYRRSDKKLYPAIDCKWNAQNLCYAELIQDNCLGIVSLCSKLAPVL